MTPEQYQQVKAIFHSALDQSPEQRMAFLKEACADDDPLKTEVESLLRSYERAGDFIERPVFAGFDDFLPTAETRSLIGDRIGPYRVEREIGHGGMGAVYLGIRVDDEYRKTVAIKVIQPGMNAASIVRRFRTERQILASLDHPNIARLLDGG